MRAAHNSNHSCIVGFGVPRRLGFAILTPNSKPPFLMSPSGDGVPLRSLLPLPNAG